LSVTHYNNELGEVVEYEMLDPPQCLAEMTAPDVAAVHVDQLTAMVGVRAHELRHRSRRVAEVREEPARKLTIDVGRHLVGVAVTAEVK